MTDPARLYAELVIAFNACHWHAAQVILSELLPLATQHAGVYGIAGVVSMELQQDTDAEAYLQRATELDPARADFATLHAKALASLARWNDALIAADRAFALLPEDPMTLNSLGVIYTKAQAHDKAAKAFSRAINISPAKASVHFNLATSLIALGDINAAEHELQQAIALDSRHWQAYLSLSQIKRQTAEQNHVETLRSLSEKYADDNDAVVNLNMALAKELEDLTDYAQAFSHLTRAKSALKKTRYYSLEHESAFFDALMRSFPSPDMATQGHAADGPIFVIGMPRSGTTLADRIITNHPEIRSAGELQNFAISLKRVSNGDISLRASPEKMIGAAAALDWKRLGNDYLSSVRSANDNQSRFVDKLPHNFLYAGFIAKALPGARIICLRRNPLDTCISNFRQLFDQSSAVFDYSFDLLDTGRYYVLFDRLMTHWQRIFPGRILELRYEDLVNEQEAESRRLMDYCELPWNEACLRFEDNPAPVATFSALQVRTPLYRSALGRWKNYETQLTELRVLLRHKGIDPDA